ncbi:DUF3592 domain-containing protein [Hymenobacter sp. M29]|uniref:DUF3592 domain-containing protein n=1 Tax=Hymenobacter mellowenesis TaxID=3063995 RepID=A0ABT9AAE4_9BACT|nr:DUF3592 domain-containing protein [Hymenobacter sp. M29]MDO7846806.1 DUF3592 domain-containing protein [Hymenobacter sp. M29]
MPRNPPVAPRWLLYSSIVLLAVAVFFAAQAWQAFRFADALRRAGVRAEGTVVDVSRPGGRYPSTVYTVEYTVRRTRYQLTNQFTTNDQRHRLDERVRVLYAPASPQVAMLDEALERNVWAVKAFLSVATLAFSGLFYKGYRAAGKASTP